VPLWPRSTNVTINILVAEKKQFIRKRGSRRNAQIFEFGVVFFVCFSHPHFPAVPPFGHAFAHQLTRIHTHSHSVARFTMPDGMFTSRVRAIPYPSSVPTNPHRQQYNSRGFPKRTDTSSAFLQQCRAQPVPAPPHRAAHPAAPGAWAQRSA